jgi:hypothetical protein
VVGALAIRVAMVAALFLFGSPDRIYVPFNVFFGDEQYMIVRALRIRAIWLGLPMRLTRSPTLRVVRPHELPAAPGAPADDCRTGAVRCAPLQHPALLGRRHRSASDRSPCLRGDNRSGQPGVPVVPAQHAAVVNAALKESFNFLIVVSTLGATVLAVRAPARWRLVGVVGVVAGLGALQTLRDGAAAIAVAGLAVGLLGAVAFQRAWRLPAALIVILVVGGRRSQAAEGSGLGYGVRVVGGQPAYGPRLHARSFVRVARLRILRPPQPRRDDAAGSGALHRARHCEHGDLSGAVGRRGRAPSWSICRSS